MTYQGRKRAKTSNILPVTDRHGFVLATTEIVAGHHNDQYELCPNLRAIFADFKELSLSVVGSYFNMDAGFDTKAVRKLCFNRGVIPNIAENKRNRKKAKPGPKRSFDPDRYAHRFCIERSFAWVDKFKRLLIRFERQDAYFKGWHFIAFALVNLRQRIQEKA